MSTQSPGLFDPTDFAEGVDGLAHIASPRILFYAVNGLGLGHVTRLLAIARGVRALRPEAQILFVTTSDADWVIFREGFAAVKIPSRSVLSTAKLRPAVYNKLVQSVVMNTVAAFNPAILVADTFPAGASQELLPTLSWEMRRAFVFRAQKAERAGDAFFQAALARYDICIAPHAEGDEQLPIPPDVRAVWTGPILIRARDEALTRADARTRLGIAPNCRAAYITFGGGGDAEMAAATAAAAQGARAAGWTPIIAQAPLERDSNEYGEAIRVSHYPMAEMLPAFDCAVSAAGYNTVAELMHFGIPSVLIPFERGLDDQHARVRGLVDRGAALTCSRDAEAIGAALAQIGGPPCAASLARAARLAFPASGAAIAAQAILNLL